MRILITEAASPLAYHVANLLATEDSFTGQAVELVLCDHRENQDVVTGVMYELQDCLYPNLKDVSVSYDFFKSFQSADIVLVLPSHDTEVRGDKQLQISHTLMSQINFLGLDGVFHQRGLDMQDQVSLRTRGMLSSAVKIVTCLTSLYMAGEKQVAQVCPYTTLAQYQEEAEFGMPPDVDGWSSYNTDNKLMIMMVSLRDCQNDKQDKQIDKDSNILAQYISRL